MPIYIPFMIVFVLGAFIPFLYVWSRSRKSEDLELESFKRGKRVWVPDETFHISIFDLQLCVSCERVHANDVCPRCGSEISLPLSRVVGSTQGLDFPIKRARTPSNVIQLPSMKKEFD